MATKTTLQSLSNTKLASGSDILASELREVQDAFLLNGYGTVISETQSATVNTVPDNATTKQYSIKYVKQGRVVTMTGFIKNNTAIIVSVEPFFSFSNAEYISNITTTFFGNTISGTPVAMAMTNDEISVVGSVGSGQTVYFNFNYFTQD